MKYFLKSLVVYLLPFFLFTACKSGAGSGEAHTIKMSLNKGDKFSQNFDMKMNMNMAMAMLKDPVDMKMDMEAGCDFEVLDNNGTEKELKITYSNMKMKMDMGAIAGAGAGAEDANEKMDKLGERFSGKSVTLKIDKANNVTSVSGFENMVIGDSIDAETKVTMEKMFSKEQFNSMFGLMFKLYPDKPVKVGESWENESELDMSNIKMKIKMKYTLAEVKDGVAKIDMKGLIDGKGKMNQGGVSVDVDLSGGQNGNLNVTMKNGYVKNGTYKMDVKGDMEVMGQKVAVKVVSDYLVKGK